MRSHLSKVLLRCIFTYHLQFSLLVRVRLLGLLVHIRVLGCGVFHLYALWQLCTLELCTNLSSVSYFCKSYQVVQLRKACSHPYLFSGIEPEPYEEGEHLVQVSST
jgi:hypothetical protein